MVKIGRRSFIKMGAGIAGGSMLSVALVTEAAIAERDVPQPDHHLRDAVEESPIITAKPAPDQILTTEQTIILTTVIRRLKKLRRLVGNANFSLLSIDESLLYARNYSKVGKFSKAEMAFLEQIFYEQADQYGFLGDKPMKSITAKVPRREVIKVRHTGNYLFRGAPLERYKQIKKDVGSEVILTSGVRGMVKQFLLFLDKVRVSKGNLSLASRSLAPPGYSFHGVSDFDVGQKRFGYANFTERFITTTVFKRLEKFGYATLRYPRDNQLGVRFEPWHIKVT